MHRRRIAEMLTVLVLLQLSLAVLPHRHRHPAVRVGEGHHDHGGSDRCVVPPIQLLPAPTCLVCALHATSTAAMAGPSGIAAPLALTDVEGVADDLQGTEPPAPRRSRGPPPVAD